LSKTIGGIGHAGFGEEADTRAPVNQEAVAAKDGSYGRFGIWADEGHLLCVFPDMLLSGRPPGRNDDFAALIDNLASIFIDEGNIDRHFSDVICACTRHVSSLS
jgi:hypothetical protein